MLTALSLVFIGLRGTVGMVFAVAPRFAVERWLGATIAARMKPIIPRLGIGVRDLVLSTAGIVSIVTNGPVSLWLGAAAVAEAIDALVAAIVVKRLDLPFVMRARAVAGPSVLAVGAALLAFATMG